MRTPLATLLMPLLTLAAAHAAAAEAVMAIDAPIQFIIEGEAEAPAENAADASVADVLPFSLHDRKLKVHINDLTQGARQLRLKNRTGAILQYMPTGGEDMGNTLTLRFTTVEQKSTRLIWVNLNQTTLSLQMQDTNSPRPTSVHLSQRMGGSELGVPDGKRSGEVKLTVTRPPNTKPMELTAPDFLTLWIQYPDEVDQYVEPLLAALDITAITEVPVKQAEQALLVSDKADPDALTAIQALLPALDADDPATRQQASRQLEALGARGAAAASTLDLSKLTVEQRLRLKTFIKTHKPLDTADRDKLRKDPLFALRAMSAADPKLAAAAHKHYESLTGQSVDFNPAAPQPDRRKTVKALLRKTLAKPETPASATSPATP